MPIARRLRLRFIDEMARFASFYTDARNEAAQHFGLPLLVFTVFFIGAQHPIAGGVVWTMLAVLVTWYVVSAPLVGTVTGLLYACIGALAHLVAADLAGWSAAGVGVATVAAGLSLRLVGRALEGRRPTMSDRVRLMLVAPAFLTAAVLFRFRISPTLELAILNRRGGHFPIGDPRWVEPPRAPAESA